jgi:hypothetical protein
MTDQSISKQELVDHLARATADTSRLRDENRKLWARDHARGHRPTADCPVCRRFSHASDERQNDE